MLTTNIRISLYSLINLTAIDVSMNRTKMQSIPVINIVCIGLSGVDAGVA